MRAELSRLRGWFGCQRLECLGGFVRQLGGVGIVDRQALGGAQVRFRRRGRGRALTRRGRLLHRAQRSASAAAEAAPITSAPRSGALREDATGALTPHATASGMQGSALLRSTLETALADGHRRLPLPFSR